MAAARRVLLAVEPAVLEGALAWMITDAGAGEVVRGARSPLQTAAEDFDAAVVSDALPAGVRAGVVVTLPDTRGGAGTGTVTMGGVTDEVDIGGAEQVIELLDRYARLVDASRSSSPD